MTLPASPPKPRVLRLATRHTGVLSDNGDHLFAARYALSFYTAHAIYTLIPKNACTTMRYTLAVANGAITGPAQFNWIHDNNHSFKASLEDLARTQYSFTILRDPFRRIASCYLDKIAGLTPAAWDFHKLSGYAIAPELLSFRDFVSGLGGMLRYGNEHWIAQLNFLVYQDYDDYFCLEDFARVTEVLRQRAGIEVLDARGLGKHGADQFTAPEGDEFYGDIPAHEIAALKRAGRLPRAEQMYDNALAEQVRTLYAPDIAFYREKTGRSCLFT